MKTLIAIALTLSHARASAPDIQVSQDQTSVKISSGEFMVRELTEKDLDKFNSEVSKILTKNPKLGHAVTACKNGIDIPVGTASGNNSYGAICKADQKSVLVCYDEMVGHFAEKVTKSHSRQRKSLIKFVAANCFGG